MKRGPRWFHRLVAEVGGYFWIPCDVCGRAFGGHESGDWTIPHPGAPWVRRLVCSEECHEADPHHIQL